MDKKLRRLVLERDGNRCRGCRTTQRLHMHHILPVSCGGKDEQINIITLCHSCHFYVERHYQIGFEDILSIIVRIAQDRQYTDTKITTVNEVW